MTDRRFAFVSAGTLVTIIVTIVSGCDARNLVGPGAHAVGRRRSESSSTAALGTASISAEQTAFVTGIPVPANAWVVVNVTGQFQAIQNPQCSSQPPNWPCSAIAPSANFSPTPAAFGPIQVQALYGANRTGLVNLRGSGGMGSAGQAVGLYFGSEAGELRARSTLVNPIAYNPNPGNPVASYLLSGSYTVSVTRIPSPVMFAGGYSNDGTGAVKYSVAAAAGLMFINPLDAPPSYQPGGIDWYFVPGDSTPAEFESNSRAIQIGACWQLTTCTYIPPKGGVGRMQVIAFVEGRLVGGRSDYVRAPKLQLICNGSVAPAAVEVERGGDLSCETASTPAGFDVRNQVWTFTDTAGHRSDGPRGESGWGGTMAVGGTMNVTASVNGQAPSTETMVVSVRPREWRGLIHYPDTVVIQSQSDTVLPYPPISLTNTHLQDGDLGVFKSPSLGYRIGRGDGPNEGWQFVEEPPSFSERAEIHLNAGLLPTDPFWRAQKGERPGVIPLHRRPYCGSDFMNLARRHVAAHEAEHYHRAKTWFESDDAARILEGFVKYALGGVVQFDSTDTRQFSAPMLASQAAWDNANILWVPCDLQPVGRR
jgi:hypothetical protein